MAVVERVPMARIASKAREIRFGPTVLTLAAGVLVGLGWLVAKVCAVAWAVVAWSWAAVRVGWQEGMAGRPAGSEPDDGDW